MIPVRVADADVQPIPKQLKVKKSAFLSKKKQKTLVESKNSRTFATAIEKQTMQAKKMKSWFLG